MAQINATERARVLHRMRAWLRAMYEFWSVGTMKRTAPPIPTWAKPKMPRGARRKEGGEETLRKGATPRISLSTVGGNLGWALYKAVRTTPAERATTQKNSKDTRRYIRRRA